MAEQGRAYLDCAKNAQKKHTWAAFFDADEYLVLKKHETVVEFLHNHCSSGAVTINWMLMGSSGRQVYDPRPVTKRFQHRDVNSYHHKSVVRLQDMDMRYHQDPHFQFLLEGHYQRDTSGNITKGSTSRGRPADVAVLYHFKTKLCKEFVAKRRRGLGSRKYRPSKEAMRKWRDGEDIRNGTVLDDSVWKAVKKYNPKYAIFDDYIRDTEVIKTEKNESAAICCLAENDEAYIDEWVDYHRAIGFDHIYIYDPSQPSDLKQWGEEKGDYVTVHHHASNHSQDDADLDCARRFGLTGNHMWMAFFNVDEFLVLRKHVTVTDMLRHDQTSCALVVNSTQFGTSGQQIYHPTPVTKRFVYRVGGNERNWNYTLKTIVRLKDTNLSNATTSRITTICENATHLDPNIAVHHHYIKSMKECRTRHSSEKMENKNKSVGDLCAIKGSVFDDSAWKTLKRNVPWYALLDQSFYEKQ
jgi:hypothetical protein